MNTIRHMFYLNWDLDSAAFKYGRIAGFHQGYGGVKTTGASTTVDAVTSGAAPFAAVLVGDYVQFYIGEAPTTRRKVLTKPSNDQITISGAAINLGTGTAQWYFLPFRIGSTDADGGQPAFAYARAWVEFEWVLADSLDISIEVKARAPSAKWQPVFAKTYAAAVAAPGPIEVTELVGSIRVGVKATTTFANTDDITIGLTGTMRGNIG